MHMCVHMCTCTRERRYVHVYTERPVFSEGLLTTCAIHLICRCRSIYMYMYMYIHVVN